MFRRKQAERGKLLQREGKGSMSLICNHLYLMNKTASESVVCICKLLDIQSRVIRISTSFRQSENLRSRREEGKNGSVFVHESCVGAMDVWM